MIFHRLSDLTVDEIHPQQYDLILFASGYEERCTFVPAILEKRGLSKAVVLGFQDVADDTQRQQNDSYFSGRWGPTILSSSSDDGVIYKLLRERFSTDRAKIRILVDYSSMSRLWYAAVLNWARFFRGKGDIAIDLLYSVGDHKSPGSPLVIDEILSIPGCEGRPRPGSKSVGVFGLGFEGSAALSVLDQLEPDQLYCYLADPAAFDDYPRRTRIANKELIGLANTSLGLPLQSVERSFAHLAELVSPYRQEANITLVPMGPKPHVLAAVLIAMRFEEITCLHVGYRRHKPERVSTTGTIVATRVHFIEGSRSRVNVAGKS